MIALLTIYPLVTHDPNMLKKVMEELTGQDKKESLPEGNYKKFPVETVHTVPCSTQFH